MITYTIDVDCRNDAEARFAETGALPPEGVKLVGRWHDVAGRRGFSVIESSEQMAVASYLRGWTDVLTFTITPVVSDEQLGQLISQGA